MYQPNTETINSLARLLRGSAWRDAENMMRVLHSQGFSSPEPQSFGVHIEKQSLRKQFILQFQPESNAGAIASFRRGPMGSYDGMELTWMLGEPMPEGMVPNGIQKSIALFQQALGQPFAVLDTSAHWSDASASEFSLLAAINWPKSTQAKVKKTTSYASSDLYQESLHKRHELVHIGLYAARIDEKLFALTAMLRA